MTQPVDVLRVLDSATFEAGMEGQRDRWAAVKRDLIEARAALAELIAADTEYDIARSRCAHAFSHGSNGDIGDQRDADDMLDAARARRAAALAGVGAK